LSKKECKICNWFDKMEKLECYKDRKKSLKISKKIHMKSVEHVMNEESVGVIG